MAFDLDPVSNFAVVTVSGSFDASAVNVSISGTDINKIPTPSTDGHYNMVWWDSTVYNNPSNDPNKEIVRVTGLNSPDIIVTRGVEATSASTKNTSDSTYKMILSPTKKTMDDIESGIQANNRANHEFLIKAAQLPLSNPAVLDSSETFPKLKFDDTTVESAWWGFRVPKSYSSGDNPRANILYSMTSPQTGDKHVLWRVYVGAIRPGENQEDSNAISYDIANTGSGILFHNQTGGYVSSLSIPLTYTDDMLSGDLAAFKIDRFSGDAQKGSGDAELLLFDFEYDKV